MASTAECDYSCPLCHNFFSFPVILSCSHSFCKDCLQQFWRSKKPRVCPLCKKTSKGDPPLNLALKNLCESFLKERDEQHSSASEEICSLHGETLRLFCLEDKQPVCLVCRDSQKHVNHTFRPISEAVPLCKVELETSLKSIKRELQMGEMVKVKFEKTIKHIKSQADRTEQQIKQQFEELHQFLRDEEEATIAALREEEEEKKQMMEEKLKEMNRLISALSHTIKKMEEMMESDDVSFLKEFSDSMERIQISEPDPEIPFGALICVPNYLGNLPFRVWKKMQDFVQYTPVILDPNTANPRLLLSDDLTSVKSLLFSEKQLLPYNPERFDWFFSVLGSEGFNSGIHCWDVEVKGSSGWSIGVTTASHQRQGGDFFATDVWNVQFKEFVLYEEFYYDFPKPTNEFVVHRELERVRVHLDYDRGRVSFSDPVTNTHLQTFTTTFTDTVFPFLCCYDTLRILPFSSQ